MVWKIKTAYNKANTALSYKGIESRKSKREYFRTLETSPACPIILEIFRESDKNKPCRIVNEVASLLIALYLQQTINLPKEDIELRWS